MNDSIPISGTIEPIPGERGVFQVSYRVDLEEFDGIGRCDCVGFESHYLPPMEEAQQMGERIPVFQCAHLKAVREYLGMDQLQCDPPPKKRLKPKAEEQPKPKKALWVEAFGSAERKAAR